MGNIHDGIVVVELVGAGIEAHVVDEVQRIYRLQELVVLLLAQLFHHGLRGIEDDALLELVVPVHLHLDDEVAPAGLTAAHVNDAVFFLRVVWHHFGRHILHVLYLLSLVKGQQGIEQAHHQVLVLAEDLLEGQVGLRVEVFPFYRLQRFLRFICFFFTHILSCAFRRLKTAAKPIHLFELQCPVEADECTRAAFRLLSPLCPMLCHSLYGVMGFDLSYSLYIIGCKSSEKR